MTDTLSCECQADHDEPCGTCRREIHQGWHSKGFWWIRPEECDETCPCWQDTVERRNRPLTARQRAQRRQLEREARGE